MAKQQERTLILREEDIRAYLGTLEEQNKSKSTLERYTFVLRSLYDALPEGKELRKGDFQRYLKRMRERNDYTASTVNSMITPYNELMRYLGYGDFCEKRLAREEKEAEELTNEQYYRLLHTAKSNRDQRGYLLIKLFVNTPIGVNDMASVTAEAVESGILKRPDAESICLTDVLKRELKEYATAEGITVGCLFQNGMGDPIARHTVTRLIAAVGARAGFEEGIITPRSLQRLYRNRREGIRQNFVPMIEESYNRMMDVEQTAVAWARY